jgi:Cu(I)/Ag(I) efflux system membrane fusion protein
MKVISFVVLALFVCGRPSIRADDFPGLSGPLKVVTEKYLVIQQKLAADSFDGVTAAATEMQTTMAADKTGSFTPDFTKSVDSLVAAKDLHSARTAFEDVSNNLIAALAQNKIQTGALHTVFCPMRKAYWVQMDGKVVHNPYFGAEMSDCGVIQRQF